MNEIQNIITTVNFYPIHLLLYSPKHCYDRIIRSRLKKVYHSFKSSSVLMSSKSNEAAFSHWQLTFERNKCLILMLHPQLNKLSK